MRLRSRQVQPGPDRIVSVAARYAVVAVLAAAACSRSSAREYELQGQVLAVDQARQEITIRHQDIPRFMPGMTMAFKVRHRHLLEGRAPGDLVKATLVVEQTDVHLRSLERTGFAPITEPSTPTKVMDLVAPGAPVRDATFVDETNSRRRLADWRGQVLAVTFIYTRCPLPNFCPLMNRHFQSVQTAIRSDPDLNGHVRLLSVSFDPEHDSPPVLAARATALRADPAIWQFLTGERDAIEQFALQLGVSVIRSPSDSEIVHNLRTAVVDVDGRLRTVLNGTDWTPADLLTELRHARAGH
jgi:protein SCO1